MLAKARSRFTRRHWMVPLCLAVMFFLTFEGGNLLNAQPSGGTRSFSDVALYRGIFFADGPVADLVPEIRDQLRLSNVINDRNVLKAIRGLHGRIIAKIMETNPAFLHSFGEAMRSGNHLRIDRALEEAAVVTVQAVAELPEINQLRARMQADPGLRDRLLAEVKKTEGADQLPAGEMENALDLVLADSLNRKDAETPYRLSASIVAIVFTVALLVAGITVVAVQSYAVVLNVGAAVVFAAAVVAAKYVKETRPNTIPEASLFREQLVDSVAVTFGPAAASPV